MWHGIRWICFRLNWSTREFMIWLNVMVCLSSLSSVGWLSTLCTNGIRRMTEPCNSPLALLKKWGRPPSSFELPIFWCAIISHTYFQMSHHNILANCLTWLAIAQMQTNSMHSIAYLFYLMDFVSIPFLLFVSSRRFAYQRCPWGSEQCFLACLVYHSRVLPAPTDRNQTPIARETRSKQSECFIVAC